MDKQLVEEFNNRYFGKNELKRRIYEESELEIIWKEINIYRKNSSIDIEVNINEKNISWYNITEEIKAAITYINDIEKSEITKYLSCDKNNNNKIQDNSKDILEGILCCIENNETRDPIIRGAILHFYVIYLSPFASENLEMAENITNRYLIENGYKIMRYCNLLEVIKNDEKRYYNALDNSIINDGDITYFIKYYVGIIQAAIKELTKEVSIKYGKKIIKELIEKNDVSLEERQIKFVNSMVILNNNKISIDDYKKKTKVSYETARSDLNTLVAIGFFKISKSGKKYEYYFNDISTIIDNFNDISVIV